MSQINSALTQLQNIQPQNTPPQQNQRLQHIIASLGTAFGGNDLPFQIMQRRKQNDLATAKIDALKTATLVDLANARLSGEISAGEHEANLKLIAQQIKASESLELGRRGTERRAKEKHPLNLEGLKTDIAQSKAATKRSGIAGELDLAKLPGIRAGSEGAQLELSQFKEDIPRIKREREIALKEKEFKLKQAEMDDEIDDMLLKQIREEEDTGRKNRLIEQFKTGRAPKIDVESYKSPEELIKAIAADAMQNDPNAAAVAYKTFIETGNMDDAVLAAITERVDIMDAHGMFDEEALPAKVMIDVFTTKLRQKMTRKDSKFIEVKEESKRIRGRLNQRNFLKTIGEALRQDSEILKQLQDSGEFENYVVQLQEWIPEFDTETISRVLTTGKFIKTYRTKAVPRSGTQFGFKTVPN